MRPIAHARTLRDVCAEVARRWPSLFLEEGGALEGDGRGRTGLLRRLWRTFRIGASHSWRVLPGQVRLWKWRAGRVLQRWMPVLGLLSMTVACGWVSQEGLGDAPAPVLAPAPSLSKTRAPASRKRADAPWTYVLPIDHGVRVDESGKGHFRAPRFHGEHNGIDLLAPIGTPVFAACDGQVMAGASRSFGNWLHVICPVPDAYRKAGVATPWASFFYAHLSESDVAPLVWHDVKRGQKLGKVGKTGNAEGASVQPHLHLELIVQQNRRAAMDEHHLGSDQSSAPAAEMFAFTLEKECLDPLGFRPKSQMLRRARRLDPFVALSCLSDFKPDFRPAPAPLDFASHAWDRFYVADGFNVNRGLEDHGG